LPIARTHSKTRKKVRRKRENVGNTDLDIYDVITEKMYYNRVIIDYSNKCECKYKFHSHRTIKDMDGNKYLYCHYCNKICEMELDRMVKENTSNKIHQYVCKYCGIPKELDNKKGCIRASTIIKGGTVKGHHVFEKKKEISSHIACFDEYCYGDDGNCQ